MIFASYLTGISYFPLERNCQKLQDTARMGQRRGVDGFSYFSLIFSYFYFLNRIIPEFWKLFLPNVEWVSDCCLRPHQRSNLWNISCCEQVTFNEMIMMSNLYLGLHDRGLNPWSTALEASMVTMIPQIRFSISKFHWI